MVDKKFHYRWDFIGLSTDTKPTPEDNDKVVNGSTFYCSDTSKLYVFYKDQWYERKPLGGGGGGGNDYNELSNLPQVNSIELKGNKTAIDLGLQPYKHEDQILGWTRITMDTDEDLDIRPQLEAGYTRFTILVYIRKGSIRQGVKYELTASELQKIGSKVQKNMVCITRTCIDPSGSNAVCTVKQCVTANQDASGNPIFGFMKIKYNLYDAAGTLITTALDNFEYCMYAE